MDKLSIEGALQGKNETYRRLLEKSDFDVGIYRPSGVDDQTPHVRDELYVIVSGTGNFVCAGERERYSLGDVFFVPAGIEHCFESFSDDFSTWVIFLGARTE